MKLSREIIHKFTSLFLPLIILVLNFSLVRPLFTGEYSQFMQSIEVSYITMAKFIARFWSGIFGGWNPLWYLGYPLYLLYTPLLPVGEVLINKIWPFISFARAYRIISGLAYCLVPLSLYFFVLTVSGKKKTAFFSALVFSIFPSINYLIGEVRTVGSAFSLAPWRLVILTLYGEGPHTLSQVFLLLAGSAYYKLLKQHSYNWLVLTALFIALTGLTNAIGLSALAVLLLAIAFVEILLGENSAELMHKLKLSLEAAGLAYGLLAFWYNFAFIKSFFGEGRGVLQNYLALFPWGLVFLFFLLGLLYAGLKKVRSGSVRVALLWFLVNAFVVASHYQWKIDYLPQALRLMTEVDMSWAMLLGILLAEMERKLPAKRLLGPLLFIAVLAGGAYLARDFLGWSLDGWQPYSRIMTRPADNLKTSPEYEISRWLQENVPRGTRAYVSGNYAFWLNYFNDVGQVRGALDQSAVHPWVLHASYQIYHGESGEISVDWAKIMNVKYIVVNTVTSREPFKDYRYPGKFQGLLKPVYREQGDIIYEVPLKDESLAKKVNLSLHDRLEEPQNAVDKEAISEYVNWLENASDRKGSKLNFRQINNSHYQISGYLKRNEAILVQMAYCPGWVAKGEDGVKMKVKRDVLGFILIQPNKDGRVNINLWYQPIIWQYAGYIVTAATVFFILYQVVRMGHKCPTQLS